MNIIKKIIIVVLLLNIVSFILCFFLGRIYIIKGLYLAYPICCLWYFILYCFSNYTEYNKKNEFV